MLKRLIILNLVLVALLVAGGIKLRGDWRAFGPAHDVALIQPKPQAFPSLAAAGATGGGNSDWTEIPSKDPFSFDRNDVDIVVAEAPAKPVGPKPFLAGTMIIGKDRWALVSPPGGKNAVPAKVGEAVGDWTIVEILEKSIQVEANGSKQSVIINDPTANVSRVAGRTEVGGGSVSQATQAAPQQNTSATPTTGQPNQPPPTQPGQGAAGHWESTPFGKDRWVPNPPSKP